MAELITEEKTHSRIGASTAKRWMNCPGSVALLEQVPRKPATKYAAEGTVAHSVAEYFLNNGITDCLAKDHPLLGTEHEQDDFTITVTNEMIEGANLYAKTIFGDMMKLGLLRFPPHMRMYKDREDIKDYLNVETSFNLKSIDDELFGTNDASVCVPFQKLIVYDYKYGAGIPVDPIENPQLMYYALGVAEAFGGLDNLGLSEIELVIVQPRAKHDDGPVRRWTTTPERLQEFAKEVKAAVAATRKKDAPCKSGSWCRFCDAKMICNAVRDEVNKIAQMEFAPVDLDTKLAGKYTNMQPPSVNDMSAEQIASVLEKAPMVKDWITEVENKALELLKAGFPIPGYKCVAKRANRVWVNENEVVANFEPLYGDEIYTERKLKSPAQLEKVVGKDSVKDLVTTADAGFTVAKETDKRPAVIAAEKDFDAILDL